MLLLQKRIFNFATQHMQLNGFLGYNRFKILKKNTKSPGKNRIYYKEHKAYINICY